MALKFLNDGFFDGKVGIGTDSPTVQFHVLGQDATFYSGAATQQMNIGRNALENIVISVSDNTNSITANQNSDDDGPHNFVLDRVFSGTGANDFRIRLGGADQVLVNKDGNVGIGTTNPSQAKLVVNGDIAIPRSNSLVFLESITGAFRAKISSQDSNPYNGLEFYTGNDASTVKMIIEDDGNVGIGTTNPSAKLEITGTTPTAGDTTLNLKLPVGNVTAGVTEMGNILFSSTDESVGGSGSIAKISTIAGNGNDAWIGQGRPTDLAFFTQPIGQTATLVEAMRINQNGNVGIGATTPITLLNLEGVKNTSIITLESTTNDANWSVGDKIGAINFYSADDSGAGEGVKASMSYEVSDGETGATNALVFNTAGTTTGTNNTERMRIDLAGNVGIGTDDPDHTLHVSAAAGNAKITSTAGGANLFLESLATATSRIRYNGLSPFAIRDDNANSDRVTILTDGYVGIGTDDPNERLHVNSAERNVVANFESTDAKAYISFKDSATTNTDTVFLGAEGDNMTFYVGNASSERMRINSAGNVGIGTTAPSAQLDILKNDNIVYNPAADDGQRGIGPTIQLNNNSTTTNTFGQIMYDSDASGQAVARIVFLDAGNASSAMAFVTENGEQKGERMRIAADGKVGIGTDSPSRLLEVSGIQGWSAGDTEMAALNPAVNGVDFVFKNASGNTMIRLDGRPDADSIFNSGGKFGIGTTSPVGKLYVGPTWNTSAGSNDLFIKSFGDSTNDSYDPQVANTSDLGITMVTDSATTAGPDTVGLTLYNDDGTAGGFSPMLLFAKLETPSSQFKTSMAGIYARSPLGTGNSGAWIDGELIFATAGAGSQGIKQRMVINKEGLVGIGTTTPTSPLQVVGIAEYTNNTTALAAGLTAGAFYRTGDDLKVVH